MLLTDLLCRTVYIITSLYTLTLFMQIKFSCRPADRIFPYTYPVEIGRAVYRRCPELQDHDSISTHSVSRLWGQATATKRGLVFESAMSLYVGMSDPTPLIESLTQDPEIIEGLVVESAQNVMPQPGGLMRSVSPILLRRDGEHHTYQNEKANQFLTDSFRAKTEALLPGTDTSDFTAEFAPDGTESTSVVDVCGNRFLCSSCPVQVNAPAVAQELVMTTGLGGLTAMGLGALTPQQTTKE